MIAKYSKKFPYAPYLNEDIGFDKSIPDNATEEEMIQAIVDLNRIATAAYNKLNPNPSIATDFNTGEYGFAPYLKYEGNNQETERRIGLLADDIISSPDLKTLESYKLIVKAKPELQEAYDKRYTELQNK